MDQLIRGIAELIGPDRNCFCVEFYQTFQILLALKEKDRHS
jgi:hypothetical protein